jgi:putative hydrolase of the HAD superfamily
MARIGRAAGFPLDPTALERAEGETKRRLDRGAAHLAPPLPDPEIERGWSAFVRTMVQLAGGLDAEASAACVRALWHEHRTFNLWRRVPEGLPEALAPLRAAGVRVCVVSNSEGRLQVLFEQLGIADAFDHALDSHVLGVEKPDPAIFRHALEHFGVPPARALHLGDLVATDIVGARAAGLRAALIDPFDHYAAQHPDVPRVPGVVEVARALLAARG